MPARAKSFLNVLRPALGDEWCCQNLLDPNSPHQLRVLGLTGIAAMKVQMQVAELGEMVFNLQTVPGFQARLEALKTNDLTSAATGKTTSPKTISSAITDSLSRASRYTVLRMR